MRQRPPNSGKGSNVEDSYAAVMRPIFEDMERCPKTIVYVPLKWCGYLNDLGVRMLSDDPTAIGVPEIAQYHAPLKAEVR